MDLYLYCFPVFRSIEGIINSNLMANICPRRARKLDHTYTIFHQTQHCCLQTHYSTTLDSMCPWVVICCNFKGNKLLWLTTIFSIAQSFVFSFPKSLNNTFWNTSLVWIHYQEISKVMYACKYMYLMCDQWQENIILVEFGCSTPSFKSNTSLFPFKSL